jgi:hypothetical protein
MIRNHNASRRDLDQFGSANKLSRRRLLQTGAAAGGGLMLSLSLPFADRHGAAAAADEFRPNAFIRIESDGRVVLIMPYVEMGQGTYTSIPMLIAEELEVDLKHVQLEHAPPNEKLYANPLLDSAQRRTDGLPCGSRGRPESGQARQHSRPPGTLGCTRSSTTASASSPARMANG